jgi:glycosyltransferase involved in cell wall biosynthesis
MDAIQTIDTTAYRPIRMMEIELTEPIQPIMLEPKPELAPCYGGAHILVRLRAKPLGMLHVTLEDGTLSAERLAEQIWAELGTAINDELRALGEPTLSALSLSGIRLTQPISSQNDASANDAFVSVVIPTHDRADLLKLCVDSLLAQTYTNYEIIIVDDAPSDNTTWELFRRVYGANPKVRYVREHRPSASWARNRGLHAARAPYTAFVDDDVILDRHWLAEIMQGFKSGKDVVCVTALLLPIELETQAQYWFEQYGGFNKGYAPRLFDLKENRPPSPLFPYTAGLFGTGGAFAFRTEWMRQLGGCDPDLRAGEDLSIFFEAVMSGHQLAYAPGAVGWHRHRRSYESLQKQIYSYGWGFSAFVTRSLVRDPRRLFGLLRRLPGGLMYMFSPKSAKNQRKQADYPAELTTLERRGLFMGPYVYFKQRWQNRHLYAQTPPEIADMPEFHAEPNLQGS